jgi:hypothetical protein
MKAIIPGGSGQVGHILSRALLAEGYDVVVFSRSGPISEGALRVLPWDGKTLGDWSAELDGADVVINLAGRSVNCRYTRANMKQMMDSRVDSTRVIGQAIANAATPPPLWLQMSTATIYAHRFDAPNDEATGIIGGEEKGVPAYWAYSIDIAKAWERELDEASTPDTRRVAMRTAMVMSPHRGGIFDVLYGMTRKGLGGSIAGGKQYLSWIHAHDFVAAVKFLIADDRFEGPVNLASPGPLLQGEFQAQLRQAAGVKIGLPAAAWMTKIGAFFMRTDTELILKSRYVVPGRLLDAGFEFRFSSWATAAEELITRWPEFA